MKSEARLGDSAATMQGTVDGCTDTERVDTERVDTERVDTERVDTERVDTERTRP
jgi:hypothetical protein